MPPIKRNVQNIETPERATVEEVEVRWHAHTPQYDYVPGGVYKLPRDATLNHLLELHWCEEVRGDRA